MKTLAAGVILVMSLFSCNYAGTEEAENPLYAEVMAVHDSVMPEISNIHALKKELKQFADSQEKENVLATINALDQADEAMMNWMAEFEVPADKSAADAYLIQQKEEISLIAKKMYEAIEKAKNVRDTLQSKQ